MYQHTYDAFTHIFFADHYRRSWFSLWESRWYGGFSVATYPPLFHQLTALISFGLGVEGAYQVVAVASTVLLTISAYLFSQTMVGREEARWSALIAAVFPSVSLLLNAFGQTPTLLSSALALLAAYAYSRYLKEGSAYWLASASLLTALSGAAHHFTFLFFVPATQLIMLMQHLQDKRKALTRTLIHVTLSIGLLFLMIWPFIEFMLSAPSRAEIPHGSRENILLGMYSFPFFWGMYGFTPFVWPYFFAIVFKRKNLLPAFIIFIVFFIIGLGGTTPLPKLMLGGLWSILTYDRFAFWTSLLQVPFLSIIVEDAGILIERYILRTNSTKENKRNHKITAASFFAGLTTTYILIPAIMVYGGFSQMGPLNHDQLHLIAEILDSYGQWKYITLGLKNQRVLLSLMTTAPTLDGGYNLAKSSHLWITSNVESVDGAKLYSGGLDFLRRMLVEGSGDGLRFVVSADPFYNEILVGLGLKLLEVIPGETQVTIWEIPYAEYAPASELAHNTIFNFIWGFAPLLSLLMLVCNAVAHMGAKSWREATIKKGSGKFQTMT